MRLIIGLFLIINFTSVKINAQGVYAPGEQDYTNLIQRYEILSGEINTSLHTSYKPYLRKDIVASFNSDSLFKSRADLFNYHYLINDSHEWTDKEDSVKKVFQKHFYTKKANAFYFNDTDVFEIHADPIIYFQSGLDATSRIGVNGSSDSVRNEMRSTYINTRGVVVRGMIDKKIGFYSSITENQMRTPYYVENRIDYDTVVQGEGFWKPFGSDGYDFFTARGYVTFNASKHIRLQFGNDRNFVGNGYRSLILSDFAAPYLFLKIETQVWKLKYTNIFAQMTADYQRSGRLFPKKYLTFHHLSLNIGKKLNVGLFESVVSGSPDNNNLELAYLNPIIFYRAIEQNLGSPHNATVGLDWRWMPIKKVSLYGQFIFDELIISNLRAGNGWWGNKFGVQGGMKYVNAFGVDNLDLQFEGNAVRPYTYAHISDFTNYQHYQQPLAHPMGANFYEAISIIRYQPLPKLTISNKSFYTKIGRDLFIDDGAGFIGFANVGTNIRRDYSSRINDFGNTIAQGYPENIFLSANTLSYMIKHNLFIEFDYTYRHSSIEYSGGDITSTIQKQSSHIVGLGLRWNAPRRQFDF